MDRLVKGRVLIFNNRFTVSGGERRGSEFDVQNLKKLFTQLDFGIRENSTGDVPVSLCSCR